MTKAVATRILGRRTGDIRACHLMAIEDLPELAGSVVVRLEIAAGGRVTAAEVVGVEAVNACIHKTVLGWSFPPAEQGSRFTASFELANEVASGKPPRCQ